MALQLVTKPSLETHWEKLICELSSRFSILWPLNKAYAAPVSVSLSLLAVRIQWEREPPWPGWGPQPQLGPGQFSNNTGQFNQLLSTSFTLYNSKLRREMPTLMGYYNYLTYFAESLSRVPRKTQALSRP